MKHPSIHRSACHTQHQFSARDGIKVGRQIRVHYLRIPRGDAHNFKNGRELAAWIGLVPRQHSTGGKQTLLGISKRGDAYLRKQLIHGARALAYHAGRKTNPGHGLTKLINRRNMNVAVVAQANKTARIVWAMLAHGRDFRPDYASKALA